MTGSDCIHKFFGGTTCRRHVKIERNYGRYLVLHHIAHPEYLNRMSGVKNCAAYHILVDTKSEYDSCCRMGSGKRAILEFQGRMNKSRWSDVEAKVKELKRRK